MHRDYILYGLLFMFSLPLMLHANDTGFQADLRTFYFSGDRYNRQDRDALAIGGILQYTSTSHQGFNAGLAFYTAHDLLNPEDEPVIRINNGAYVLDTSDISGNTELVQADGSSIDTLGEAYILYTLANSTLKLGRQRLDTPLVNDYYNRFLPNSFEALTLSNTDIPDTELVGIVIDAWKYKSAERFTPIAGGIGLDERLYLLGIKNSSLEFAPFQIWGYHLPDALDTFYALLSLKEPSPVDAFALSADLQYLYQQDNGKAVLGALNTYLAGMQVSLKSRSWFFKIMFDLVGDDTIRGSGTDYATLGWSRFLNFTDLQIDGESLNAGAFSYGTVLEYIYDPHLKAAVKYVRIDQDAQKQFASITPNRRPDSNEYNFDMTYHEAFGKTRLRLGYIDYEKETLISNEYDELNVRLIYDFRF